MTTPRAIARIATLPVFFKLDGRRALVAGGTPPAVWKAELLAAAGAHVLVLAAAPCDAMAALAAACPDRLTLVRRAWTPADLAGTAIAVGAFEADEGSAFQDAARAAGVPVNVIDVPTLCDFQFGTIVARSPLVIGISTDGATPVLAQVLRTRIEALLPLEIGAWARAAAAWRGPLQDLKLGFAARRRFWERFADLAFEKGARMPADADRDACMASALAIARSPEGRVILVGAGPGAPDLVTLQAVRALQSADVIVYDADIAEAVLELGRREATRMAATADMAAAVGAIAADGRTVAWVGSGDAGSCAIWTERAAMFDRANIKVETVRGIRCDDCARGCEAAARARPVSDGPA